MERHEQSGSVTRIVISDGSLPGLVAAAVASEETVRRDNLGTGTPMIWVPVSRPASAESVQRHASSLGVRVSEWSGGHEDGISVLGGAATRLLLDAGAVALDAGCSVIIWPVMHQARSSQQLPDVETIADSVNRATLVGRLVSLDAPSAGLPEVRFETPYVDMTDAQLAELACDLGVRFEDCWWWKSNSSEASVERARWGPLLPLPA